MKPRIGIMSRYLAKDNRFVTKAGYIYAISAVGGLSLIHISEPTRRS